MKQLIVITGPTGVGKTELCLQIAEHYGIDIINADSRQIYSEIPIGTAAPSDEQMKRVRHYFVGNHHVGDYYSASLYEQEVLKLIEKSDKTLHLLTGGSMMYVDAVCNGIDDIPTVRDDIREMMKRKYAEEGLESLLDDLQRLDPEHYEIVDKKNPRRIIHALEICYQTGNTYSSYRVGEKKKRSFDIIKIGLNRDRDELYERINARVIEMMHHGLEEEAKRMLPFRTENSLNTVGYKEMFQYFDGLIPYEEAVRQIQSNTRRYARKQLTWYKRDTEMVWFHPENIKEIIKYIDSRL